jgi:hypothetical protein
MKAKAMDFQVVAAVSLALAAAVISPPGYERLFATAQFILLNAGPHTDAATTGYNPSGVAVPP